MRALFGQFVRFGVVGLVGVVVDVGIFNLLRLTVLAPELIHEGPVIAKVISTSIAIVTNWIGNRYWTFGSMRRSHVLREGLEFALVSVGGMGIALLCLWVSHYLLGFTSALADNIATNVVGLALGTAFRFTFYRIWVFRPELDAKAAGEPESVSRVGSPR
jgi:putative flippase GtrA